MSSSVENTNKKFLCKNFNNIAKQTLYDMWKYAKQELFFDVILIAEEDKKKILAHRSVLSSRNEYFLKEFKQTNNKEITISNVSGDILEILIEYCYTGIIDITENNVKFLLPASSIMSFPDVVNACTTFLISSINTANCLSLSRFAKRYNYKSLLACANKYMKEHFTKFTLTNAFLNLSQDDLEEYLSFDNLNLENEKNKFQAILRWVDYDSENRSCALTKLLSLIRLHSIDKSYLLEYVVKSGHKKYHLVLTDGIKKHLFNTQLMSEEPKKITADKIVIVCQNKIQVYYPSTNVVELKCNIPPGFRPALIKEKVILVGENNKVRCFDLNTKTWNFNIASTIRERIYSSIETLNDYVYAVGGWLDGQYLNTVERWDSKLNQWNYVSSMNQPRRNHNTAILNGKLYAIGGCANNTILNSVECYDPSINEWSICSPMLTARAFAIAVAANDVLFVFGGMNSQTQTLNCVEKYNSVTKTWTKVAEMSCHRKNMGAFLFNDKIYLLGGFDGMTCLKSMDEFDPVTNECRLMMMPNIEYKTIPHCFSYISTLKTISGNSNVNEARLNNQKKRSKTSPASRMVKPKHS